MKASPDAPAFVHPALFYADDAAYLAGAVPFIEDGLAAGEPVAVAAPEPRLDLLRAALGERVGRVRLIDMARAGRNPGHILPGVLLAHADTHPRSRVRIIGEPVWAGRSEAEYPACVQHEALINQAFAGRAATILCPYDTSRLSRRALDDARTTHPLVIEGGTTRTSRSYSPAHALAACNQLLPRPSAAPAFAFAADHLAAARAFAAGHAAAAGLTARRQDDLAMVLGELTANSIIHGGGSGILRIWVDGGLLVCEVQDRGHIDDPLAGRRPARPEHPGSRGLLMVNAVADLVRTHTTAAGTTTRCYFGLA
ncbi:anti-sigma factor RsbA family regulatory protein [Streptomyces sp. ISL-86]|uniref:anti-sigma factor RsbA family regulatory protein n=1 Tax=Streptomyces sp. ISL-86 TaxID=2819187 RepID=UPI001BE95B27|nr:anti-sigma factor RsbA family regulatory protein [Streptomyces sp. ISL-86]MBT2455777.1 MEDS domain-containing protein [Streptomyces sp. ISL-86]